MTRTTPARATKPHISIIGQITPDELRRYLDTTEVLNGFGNRFLWVCVKRSKPLPRGGNDVDLDQHLTQLRAAVQYAKGTQEIARDEEAGRLWDHVYARLSGDRPGLFGAMTARAAPLVMRMACIYALADASSVIGRVHLEAALAVWRYCSDSARHLFGDRLGDPAADEIRRRLQAAPDG